MTDPRPGWRDELAILVRVVSTVGIWSLAGRFVDVSNRWLDVAAEGAVLLMSAALTSGIALLIGHGPTFLVNVDHQNIPLEGRAGPIEIRANEGSIFLVVRITYWGPWLGKRLSQRLFAKPLDLTMRFTPDDALTRCLIDHAVRGAKARPREGKSGLIFTVRSDPKGGEVSSLRLEVAPDLRQGSLELSVWCDLSVDHLGWCDRRRVRVRSVVSSIRFTLHR